MPALRQMSATGIPSLPCFKMNAFCASENFDAFIVFRSSQPGTQTGKTLAKNDPVFWEQIRADQEIGAGAPVEQYAIGGAGQGCAEDACCGEMSRVSGWVRQPSAR